MNKLIYDIADEYLPDVTVLGVDGPNTGLAREIVNKVLDAAASAVEQTEWQGGDPIEAINKLRGES